MSFYLIGNGYLLYLQKKETLGRQIRNPCPSFNDFKLFMKTLPLSEKPFNKNISSINFNWKKL